MVKRKGPLTREELDAQALSYLDRFDSSRKNLRRVLTAYANRAAAPPEASAWIDELIERYLASGVLDDARFAGSVASGLRRRGSSKRAIVQKLQSRGVEGQVAAAALAGVDADGGNDAELEAARAFARRRRLGAFRPESERAASYRRDMGALARAGFDMDVARRALGSAGGDDDGEW